VKYLIMLIIPFASLISATSGNLIQFFYSSQFSAAGTPLSILMFGMCFFSIFTLLTTIINASGRPTTSMIFGIATILVNVMLNLALIPVYQLVGAALATSVSILFGILLAGSYVYAKFKALMNFSSLLKILLASTVIFLISMIYAFSGIALLAQYVILFALYFLLLYLLKGMIEEDIQRGKVILKTVIQTKGC